MKNDLKTVLYMGLGALAESSKSLKEVGDNLYEQGKELYEKGVIANEELKHNIHEAMKENVTVVNVNNNTTKEDILKNINNLSKEDKEALINELTKGNDVKHEGSKGSKGDK